LNFGTAFGASFPATFLEDCFGKKGGCANSGFAVGFGLVSLGVLLPSRLFALAAFEDGRGVGCWDLAGGVCLDAPPKRSLGPAALEGGGVGGRGLAGDGDGCLDADATLPLRSDFSLISKHNKQ